MALSLSSNESIFTNDAHNPSTGASSLCGHGSLANSAMSGQDNDYINGVSPKAKSVKFATGRLMQDRELVADAATKPSHPGIPQYKSTPVVRTRGFRPRGATLKHAKSSDGLTPPSYPMIDLDVASRPLTPRRGGVAAAAVAVAAANDNIQYMAKNRYDTSVFDESEDDEGDDDNDDENDGDLDDQCVGIVDFLRESMSTRAMSISEEYNPMDFVNVGRLMDVSEVLSGLH